MLFMTPDENNSKVARILLPVSYQNIIWRALGLSAESKEE